MQVVGALLDAEAEDSFINNLILSVRSLMPVESLVAEVEARNKLKMLNPFLEQLVSEGSKVGGGPAGGGCRWRRLRVLHLAHACWKRAMGWMGRRAMPCLWASGVAASETMPGSLMCTCCSARPPVLHAQIKRSSFGALARA